MKIGRIRVAFVVLAALVPLALAVTPTVAQAQVPPGTYVPPSTPAIPPATAPTGLTAVPGDASVLLEWTHPTFWGPHPTGGWEVAIYSGGVAVSSARESHVDGSDLGDARFLVSGLTNGSSYSFTVRAVIYNSSSEELGPVSEPSAVVTPQAGLIRVDAATSTTLESGSEGFLSTSSSVSPSDPAATSVYVPTGTSGTDLSITELSGPNITAPSGYAFFGQQVDIVAPAATWDNPLVLEFLIDASLIPAGTLLNDIQLIRTEGGQQLPLQPCSSPMTDPYTADAIPDPCLYRVLRDDGDVVLTALTAHASSWNTGLASQKRTAVAKGCAAHQHQNHGCTVATKR